MIYKHNDIQTKCYIDKMLYRQNHIQTKSYIDNAGRQIDRQFNKFGSKNP